MTSPGPRLVRMRRACLKAGARVLERPEPSDADCDRAPWDRGLRGALNSLPQAAPPAELAGSGSRKWTAVDTSIVTTLGLSWLAGGMDLISAMATGLWWMGGLLAFLLTGRGRG